MKYHNNVKRNKFVTKITNCLNKHGDKIKCKNKKEKKILISTCPHHIYTRKGKCIPTIEKSKVNGESVRVCYLCGEEFSPKFYKDDNLKQVVGDFKDLLSQARFMSVAVNAGNEMIDYFCNLSAMVQPLKKSYKKVRKVAEKQGEMSKKKKKTINETRSLGDWNTTGRRR